MHLREAAVDVPAGPCPLARGRERLLQPVQAIIVSHAPYDVRPPVAVDVMSQYEDAGGAELEVRVERPLIGPFLLGLLVPAFERDDVQPPVTVHVADAHAMSGALLAQLMLDPLHLRLALGPLVPDDGV